MSEEFERFLIYFESGAKGQERIEDLFAQARKRGYSDDPHDHGGATMVGVTLGTYRSFKAGAGKSDLRGISYETWRTIVKRLYWDRWQADKIVYEPLRWLLVDWVWASGVYGIKRPQRIVGVAVDGKVGPKTLEAVNGVDGRKLFEAIKADRHRFISEIIGRRPDQKRYERGWRRRLDAITPEGLKI